MGITVEVGSIRTAWMNAKKELFNSRRALSSGHNMFWKMLGEENRMKVVISGYNGSFPVIDIVEFEDNAAAAWFILKWS